MKASGLERFPFTNLDANTAWLALVCLAADLVRYLERRIMWIGGVVSLMRGRAVSA